MIKIFLCDDEKVVYDSVKEIILKNGKEEVTDYDLSFFSSGEELLKHETDCDILLLDIEMPLMDGIETARRLKERKSSCVIIMLTSNVSRFKEAFMIGALRYVTKPIDEEELFEALHEAENHLIGRRILQIEEKGIAHSIQESDIVYLMSNRNATCIYTKNREFRSQVSLQEWMERLDERIFFLCHRSYMVNMGHINDFSEKEASLETGERIPVSRRKYQAFFQKYMEYEMKYK